MDAIQAGPAVYGPYSPHPVSPTPAPEPARTGAFAAVHTRWLPLWALIGALLVSGLAAGVTALLGVPFSDELAGALLYLPIIVWLAVMVVRRGGVDLRAMLRWPRLGRFWWVVAGLLVVQFFFSVAAITITELVAPTLDDALAGVGQGNLVAATLGIVVLPPLVEEIVFRGVLIERFAVKWRVTVAIVLSAIFFGILHADPVGAGVFGVITALLYLRSGSLWPGILIHAANNAVALIATRATGTAAEAPPTDVAESLITAGVFLALSLPFLVWFAWRNWPQRGDLTPYQAHERAVGLPERGFRAVAWSGAPAPVRLTASVTHLVVAPDQASSAPLAILPVAQVAAAYPVPALGGEQVVVLLRDGSWTTMQVRAGKPKANRELARTIEERARFSDLAGSPWSV